MMYQVDVGGRARVVEVVRQPGGYRVRVEGGPWEEVSVARHRASWRLERAGRSPLCADLVLDGDRFFASAEGRPWIGQVLDSRDVALGGDSSEDKGRIVTEMPGSVVRVPVEAGQRVQAGQVLVVVEAMKMENEFKAPFDGVVDEVLVQPGASIDGGAVLVVVSAHEV